MLTILSGVKASQVTIRQSWIGVSEYIDDTFLDRYAIFKIIYGE